MPSSRSKTNNPSNSITQLLRKNFFAGVLVLIPVAIIIWILSGLFDFIGGFYQFVPLPWRPGEQETFYLNATLTIGFTFSLVILVSLLGWISKLYLGQKALNLFQVLMDKIPFLGTVYKSIDQLLKAFSAGANAEQFNRVVYIEFPRKNVWTLGFVTGNSVTSALPKKHLNIFVPTVPNPTSGFFLIAPEAEVIDTGLSVEEAFRQILSLGTAQPQRNPKLIK